MKVKDLRLAERIEAQPLSRRRKGSWMVHLFTATGAIWGFLALIAIQKGDYRQAFAWMFVAFVVDCLDGTLARLIGVAGSLPTFDGCLLDNIVDYFTYVIVPAYLLYQANLLPKGWGTWGAAIIIISSAYQFCQADAKTEDHFFKGFPSMWNAVVIYLLLLNAPPWLSAAVILLCAIFIFVPTKYAYPSRMPHYKQFTIGMIVLWVTMLAVVIAKYPTHPLSLVWLSLLGAVYYIAVSIISSRRSAHAVEGE